MVIETMFLVVRECVFNQTQGYWLFFDALNGTLSINVFVYNEMEWYEINDMRLFPSILCKAFWVWIGGFVHLYDGRNQGSPCTIGGIYIYLWCYQGLQHACIDIGLVVQIFKCFENIYWKGHNYTDCGNIQGEEFDAIVGDFFSVFKSWHWWWY